MPTYRSHIVLNTSVWLVGLLREIKEDKVFPPHFHTELFQTFFLNLNELIRRAQTRFLDNRLETKEAMLTTMMADLEGGYRNPHGMLQPVEFEPRETEIIVQMVCYLLDDIMSSVDVTCLEDPSSELEFMRLVGHDTVVRYTSNRHPFLAASDLQLRVMRRLNPEDLDHDLTPIRRWI
jgi:hypothetical protein